MVAILRPRQIRKTTLARQVTAVGSTRTWPMTAFSPSGCGGSCGRRNAYSVPSSMVSSRSAPSSAAMRASNRRGGAGRHVEVVRRGQQRITVLVAELRRPGALRVAGIDGFLPVSNQVAAESRVSQTVDGDGSPPTQQSAPGGPHDLRGAERRQRTRVHAAEERDPLVVDDAGEHRVAGDQAPRAASFLRCSAGKCSCPCRLPRVGGSTSARRRSRRRSRAPSPRWRVRCRCGCA